MALIKCTTIVTEHSGRVMLNEPRTLAGAVDTQIGEREHEEVEGDVEKHREVRKRQNQTLTS